MYLSQNQIIETCFCHTRTQLTIPDHLIFIPDDQLEPQVAIDIILGLASRPAIRHCKSLDFHLEVKKTEICIDLSLEVVVIKLRTQK